MNFLSLLINEYETFIELFDYKYIFIPITIVIALFITVMYIVYISHCFIHELGHLTFGLFNGCKILSFRIGKYALIKEHNRIRVKIHKVKGSGGQCLLGEPKLNYRVSQYFIILGGILFNLGLSMMSLLISIYVPTVIKAICYLSCFVGISFLIINGLPLRSLSIVNDGKCFVLIRNNKEAQRCYYMQSKICRLLFESKSYQEMPTVYFNYEVNSHLDNELIGYMTMMKYYYCLEIKDYRMASWYLSIFEPYENRLSKEALLDLYYEKLYLELLTFKREYVIEKLVDSNTLRNDFNKQSTDINRIRVKMAYELIYTKNNLLGMQYYNKAKLYLIKHQVPGEVKFQYTMMNRILK